MSTLIVSYIHDPLGTGVVFAVPPRVPTPVSTDNSTATATTAFVQSAIAAVSGFTLGSTSITAGSTTTVLSGLTLNSSPIGSTTPSTGAFTTLGASGTSTLNIANVATLNATTLSVSTLTATGGTMNGVVIGGSSPAAGSFSNLAATGTVNLSSAATVSVPTVTSGTNSTIAASTAFVGTAVATVGNTAVATASPPGCVCLLAGQNTTSAPTGWLKCNGASVLRTDFPALFLAIGTLYGSADGTHFNLPDLRGEFPRFFDDGKGVDAGRAMGTWQADQLGHHNHVLNTGGEQGGTGGTGYARNSSGTSFSTSDSVSIAYSGGTSNGGESRPRNFPFLACIKY